MKLLRLISFSCCLLLLSCAGDARRSATTAGLTGAGAALGNSLDDGGTAGSVIGAAAGYAGGELLAVGDKNEDKTIYNTGYDKGRSDAIKQTYWMKKRLHRPDEMGEGLERKYYEIPVPGHVARDGAIIDPHTRVIEIVE